jgi:serine/threonine protein kinase
MRAKISDFGLSREGKDESLYYESKGGKMPIRWTAPEAMDKNIYSTASDIWSFGVLVFVYERKK